MKPAGASIHKVAVSATADLPIVRYKFARILYIKTAIIKTVTIPRLNRAGAVGDEHLSGLCCGF